MHCSGWHHNLLSCQCPERGAECLSLNRLQVASVSKVRGNMVLHFLAGGRAVCALSDMLLREARLNAVRHQPVYLA
jgi:hypothetical protein